jgi:hypothetical protein
MKKFYVFIAGVALASVTILPSLSFASDGMGEVQSQVKSLTEGDSKTCRGPCMW